MDGFTFTNKSDRNIVVIVEPVADEYTLKPREKIEVSPPLFLYEKKIIDFQIGDNEIIIFIPEDAVIRRNGEIVGPDGS